jgi:hypothetical protein
MEDSSKQSVLSPAALTLAQVALPQLQPLLLGLISTVWDLLPTLQGAGTAETAVALKQMEMGASDASNASMVQAQDCTG